MSKVNGRKAAHDRNACVPDGAVRIAVENGPISDVVADADGGRLLVTNYGGDSVSVVDPYAFQVIDTIAGLSEPFAIAMGGGRAYVSVATPAYDAIAVIDPGAGEVVATHPLASRISDLAVSPDGGYVYAGLSGRTEPTWRSSRPPRAASRKSACPARRTPPSACASARTARASTWPPTARPAASSSCCGPAAPARA